MSLRSARLLCAEDGSLKMIQIKDDGCDLNLLKEIMKDPGEGINYSIF